MAERTITAFFDTYDDAAKAVRRLEASGLSHDAISMVANNPKDAYSQYATRTFDSSDSPGHQEARNADTHADSGVGAGATIGTLAGGGAGLLAGLGMLAIPGLGPVVAAGWLVSTLLGAGAGAAVGGLAGSLVGAGVPERDAHVYAEGVRRGGAVVTVRADEAETGRIADILDDEGRVDINEREKTWRSDGWSGPAIGAAASTTTGLTTGLAPFGDEPQMPSDVEVEDDRVGRDAGITGSGRERI